MKVIIVYQADKQTFSAPYRIDGQVQKKPDGTTCL